MQDYSVCASCKQRLFFVRVCERAEIQPKAGTGLSPPRAQGATLRTRTLRSPGKAWACGPPQMTRSCSHRGTLQVSCAAGSHLSNPQDQHCIPSYSARGHNCCRESVTAVTAQCSLLGIPLLSSLVSTASSFHS